MRRPNENGTTLIEILIATLVFSLALGALLSSLGSIVEVIDISRDKTQALVDARNMMERMRATAFNSLVTRFPNATVNGPGSNPYQNITGNYTLRGENVTVTYVDTNADPLEMRVTIAWLSKNGHPHNLSLITQRSR